MGKILVVAEKPSAAADMAKVLGCTEKKDGYIESDQYIVTWAVGHLIGLKYPQEHDPKYEAWNLEDLPLSFPIAESLKVLPDTKKQFQVIKSLISRDDIDFLVNAGDAGREGYLIQEWIYRLAGNSHPKKVLWASSLTEEALKKAFLNLHSNEEFEHILPEAEARAEGDWLMGINYSRFLTLCKGGGNTTLTYGRCQTPLLYLIYKRDKSIAEFKPTPFYNIQIKYSKGFTGILVSEDNKKKDIYNREKAEELLRNCNGKATVTSYLKERKKKKPPLLFNLSALQKAMGSKYGYAPDVTLGIAQKLYEERKLLSYPRTDSQYLSMDVFNEVKRHLDSCRFGEFECYIDSIGNVTADKRYFNDHKVTDHHALIPTIHPSAEQVYLTLCQEEKNVYDAIVRSFISIFLPDNEYDVTEIVTKLNTMTFKSKGTTIVNEGYKTVMSIEVDQDDKEKENEEEQALPVVAEGEELELESSLIQDKMTQPQTSYTVSSLIGVMEKFSIGTSATRAEIIKKLLDPKHPYVRTEKNKYYITQLGADLIKIIPEELKTEKLTEQFEKQLSDINEGKLDKEVFLYGLINSIKENMNKLKGNQETVTLEKKSLGNCPICGSPVYENLKAYSCSSYQDGCKFVIWKQIAGKGITTLIAEKLLEKGYTGAIKGFTAKNGKRFDAGLVIKSDKTIGFKFQ